MKVACVSYFLPGTENRSGPSSLLYQLVRHRPPTVDLTIFVAAHTLDALAPQQRNVLERDLSVRFERLHRRVLSRWESLSSSWWPLGAREIRDLDVTSLSSFDLVWGYPYWTAPLVRKTSARHLISGMDSATLLYWRKFRRHLADGRFSANADLVPLIGNACFEVRYLGKLAVHTVGRRDAAVLRAMGARPTYVSHPLVDYPMADAARATQRSRRPRLLLSNAEAPFYGSQRARDWLLWLSEICAERRWSISLLLHKASSDFESWAQKLLRGHPGVKLEFAGWISDYSALLETVDIQLFPLDIGAGTKTSALTAMQHGVIGVGTQISFENIEGDPAQMRTVLGNGRDGFEVALSDAMATARGSLDGEIRKPLAGAWIVHDPAAAAASFWQLAARA